VKDKHLKPEAQAEAQTETVPKTRRAGGPRRDASEAVHFHLAQGTVDGWALNVSKGGLRAIIEETLEQNTECEVTIGDSEQRRPCRIVWVRNEKGGAVLGVSFTDEETEPVAESVR
jgi:hypothetical protein